MLSEMPVRDGGQPLGIRCVVLEDGFALVRSRFSAMWHVFAIALVLCAITLGIALFAEGHYRWLAVLPALPAMGMVFQVPKLWRQMRPWNGFLTVRFSRDHFLFAPSVGYDLVRIPYEELNEVIIARSLREPGTDGGIAFFGSAMFFHFNRIVATKRPQGESLVSESMNAAVAAFSESRFAYIRCPWGMRMEVEAHLRRYLPESIGVRQARKIFVDETYIYGINRASVDGEALPPS